MRDPEMYNYVRQVLQSMKKHHIDLRRALGMHGNNMTKEEVRDNRRGTCPAWAV